MSPSLPSPPCPGIPDGFPKFLAQPKLKSVEKDKVARLTCDVSGSPEPTISWLKDKMPVELSDPRLDILSTVINYRRSACKGVALLFSPNPPRLLSVTKRCSQFSGPNPDNHNCVGGWCVRARPNLAKRFNLANLCTLRRDVQRKYQAPSPVRTSSELHGRRLDL
ncbi:hypothetical protein RRG08_014343 [Elysia crispata]|uniref:Ig-like domain-containing protein n=1 Tax=Elysia crispata TaxID=231223 RepID=A0AAE0XNG9_9GAST|nr:hypothetical protein RRG08_014343 [Elysia crispata]